MDAQERRTLAIAQRFGTKMSGGHFRSKRLSPKSAYPLKIAATKAK
ncbi:hypothetical protein [Desulfitobacterium metallireducens]|nr:hypothetical protein [Desulfitobacterium metallireducens]